MPVKTNKNIYIRRALFTLIIVLGAAVQHSGFIPSVFGARALLLIPAAVAVAMHEKSVAGLFFGALSGVLWDFASGSGDGFYSASLALVGFAVAAVTVYYLRRKIYTAYILGIVACVLVEVTAWAVFILVRGYDGAFSALLSFYLPSAVYTSLFVLPYYGVVHLIASLTAEKKINLN